MEQPDSPPAAPIISDWVRVVWAEGGHRALRVEKEVLGFAAEGSRIRIKAAVDLDGAVCCPGPSRGGGEGLVRRELVFEPLSGESLSLWCKKLQDYMDNLGRPKRLFIFMNPFGGKRMAPKIFSNEVKPLLQDAGIEFDIQETRYQLHAKEIARSIDLSKYDGIVCVSGDGILVE
ncbi:hypothetical protein CRG98_035960, partial [Punica granatum]